MEAALALTESEDDPVGMSDGGNEATERLESARSNARELDERLVATAESIRRLLRDIAVTGSALQEPGEEGGS